MGEEKPRTHKTGPRYTSPPLRSNGFVNRLLIRVRTSPCLQSLMLKVIVRVGKGFLPSRRIRRAKVSHLQETSGNQDTNQLGKFLGRSFRLDEIVGLACLPELPDG